MYYSRQCSYCNKVFYTFNDNKEHASRDLFAAIKKHLQEYDEDRKEYQFDEAPEIEEDQMYEEMVESPSPPPGGYEIS